MVSLPLGALNFIVVPVGAEGFAKPPPNPVLVAAPKPVLVAPKLEVLGWPNKLVDVLVCC